MTLVKTSVLSAIATIVKILTGFIITKVIAVYIGPAGLAMVGQLQNFINLILMFAGDFLKTATTKYTAEYIDNQDEKYQLWSSVFSIILILNIVIFITLFFFSTNISEYLLKSDKYSYILQVLAISLPFFALNTMVLSILNGEGQIQKYITLSIVLSIVSLALVVLLSIKYGVDGALVAYVINQSIVFLITLFFIQNEKWFRIKNFLYGLNYVNLKKLFGFAMITLVAVLSSNISLIYIRNFISDVVSVDASGYWQGIWVLSQVSLGLIAMSLSTYFLPTISSLKEKNEISQELKKAIVLILPIVMTISLGMYFFRDLIIEILYTEDFFPMRELFLWQMIGNVIKACGWLYGYVLVAKAMVKYTVFTEIVFAILFITLSIYLINIYGLVGVTYAYCINSFIHFITMFYIYNFKLKEKYV